MDIDDIVITTQVFVGPETEKSGPSPGPRPEPVFSGPSPIVKARYPTNTADFVFDAFLVRYASPRQENSYISKCLVLITLQNTI